MKVFVVRVPFYEKTCSGTEMRAFKSRKNAERFVLKALNGAVKAGKVEAFEDASEHSQRAGILEYALSHLEGRVFEHCEIEP
jgi:hypothetical protein